MTTRQTVTIQSPDDRDQIARWARNVETGTVKASLRQIDAALRSTNKGAGNAD